MGIRGRRVAGIRSFLLAALCACGSTEPPPPRPLEVRVTGLLGSGLVLQNGGGDDLAVAASGTVTFTTPIADGAAYQVTIRSQPGASRCVVEGGSGTMGGGSAAGPPLVTCPVAYRAPLAWMRCTHGQRWNGVAGDCTGTGSAADGYGAALVQYCSDYGNACNGGTPTGLLGPPASGFTSSLYEACNRLNAGGGTFGLTTWRVPTKGELAGLVACSAGPASPLPDFSSCAAGSSSPAIDAQAFPGTVAGGYLSASPFDSNYAWGIYFQNGFANNEPKLYVSDYVRCVAGP